MSRRQIDLAVLLSVCCLGMPRPAVAGPVLIGGSPNGVLYDIDPATGLATNPRDTGLRLGGLAFSSDGVLYGLARDILSEWSLHRIDPQSGTAIFISDVPRGAPDIEFDATLSVLLGFLGTTLFSIDPFTGEVVDLANIPDQAGSIAVNALGEAYLLNPFGTQGDVLVAVDKTTGEILNQWELGVDLGMLVGTTFSSPQKLWLVDSGFIGGGLEGPGVLYTFDVDAGILERIGPTGPGINLTTLAYVPDPSALLLLLAGLVFVTASKARRREFVAYNSA